jgi:regulator of cell morphogenesis and NO signaling
MGQSEFWKKIFMENIVQQSIASLVLSNHQIVPVLEKYNIDFCCRGKHNLVEACKDKGLDLEKVLGEIDAVQKPDSNKTMPLVEMSQAQLVNHIIVNHHYYVKHAMPTIVNHLEKIARKHGATYAYMIEVKSIFESIQTEMDLHMKKEELILFPGIIQAEKDQADGSQCAIPKKDPADNSQCSLTKRDLSAPILMMEKEHEHAGDGMFEIRRLTNNYSIPAGACTTFQVCMAELREFESDLHQHVHLENNILFPRALKKGLPV